MNIQEWLEDNGSFADGLHLYKQTNYSSKILRRLEPVLAMNYVPQAKMDLLRSELKAHLHSGTKQVIHKVSKEIDPLAFSKGENERRVQLHKIHSRVYADMCSATTDEDRYLYAKKIMEEIIPALDDFYSRKSSSNSLNVDIPVDPIRDAVNKMIELQNLKKRVSRLNGYIAKESIEMEKQNNYKQELVEVLERIKKLSEHLGL